MIKAIGLITKRTTLGCILFFHATNIIFSLSLWSGGGPRELISRKIGLVSSGLITVRVKGGMILWNGMWHGLQNDIIMWNLICGKWRKEKNSTGKYARVSGALFFCANSSEQSICWSIYCIASHAGIFRGAPFSSLPTSLSTLYLKTVDWLLTTRMQQWERNVVLGWAGVCGEGWKTSSPKNACMGGYLLQG